MEMFGNIAWWIAGAIALVIFGCGIYMLATGKVPLSYLTIGAGNFTEESKRAFSRFGGLAIILGMPGVALFKLGLDILHNTPMWIIGLIMAIVGIACYFMGRKKLVKE